ncbi:MAG: transketolase, partial [Bacteroidia bacterium]|nr:transketolase [Bacteroidia bacterium]
EFSVNGNEVAFGTIGDASTSEGPFFDTINAAGVLQVPMAISVWDDGYGISVPRDKQTTKGNISKVLSGFAADIDNAGYLILKGKGWDYAGLCNLYNEGITRCRKEHVPVLFHIQEMTQPQGHSTSGSHERYKSKERLAWEHEFDCIKKMREWIIQTGLAEASTLDEIEQQAKITVKEACKAAWKAFQAPILAQRDQLLAILKELESQTAVQAISSFISALASTKEPLYRELTETARKAIRAVARSNAGALNDLRQWIATNAAAQQDAYSSWLYTENEHSAMAVSPVAPIYPEEKQFVDGREILRDNYDAILAKNPFFMVFGEDAGNIGGVNQTLEGMQKKYGELRVGDTGIREATIVGQGIGLAMRGLRPIAEIQYLDYLLYALQVMSDDLATLRYRTKGAQKAPLIISTRGHRLEGVWHSGSPMGMIVHAVRGMYVCVPRNMTQAAGFYNTLLAADDPGLVIEPLNGYRLKEARPENLGEFRVELGLPEILQEGTDLTLLTYGSCCRIAADACRELGEKGVSVELIDVQTLLPFDRYELIAKSLEKTGKLLVLDEDVPGGASAYILQQVLEKQGAFRYLDAEPRTLTAKEHRPAYGSDGDYFSKPSVDDVFEMVWSMMNEYNPTQFPAL